jgi:hypothetical protein
MARPVVSEITEDLYTILKPVAFADEANGWALLILAEAVTGALQEVLDLSEAQTVGGKEYPPWSQAVDIVRTPDEALAWLGQFVGVTAPKQAAGQSDVDYFKYLREYIKEAPGFKRGSPGAMVAQAQFYLTNSKTVIFRERNGGAYKLTIKTLRSETPVEDWEATNIVSNPSFEVNTTGWSSSGTNLITRITTLSRFGIASILATINDNVRLGTIAITPTANTYVALSAYIWIPDTYDGGAITMTDDGTFAGATLVSRTFSDLALRNTWQRIETVYLLSADVTGNLVIQCGSLPSASHNQVYIDGVQAEVHNKTTPYTDTTRVVGLGPVGNALRSQKPAGIILTYSIADGQDYTILKALGTYQTVFTTYTTYQNLLEHV